MSTEKVFNRFLKRSAMGVQSDMYSQYQMLIKYHRELDRLIFQTYHNYNNRVLAPRHLLNKTYRRIINERKNVKRWLEKYEILITWSLPAWCFGKGSGLVPVKRNRAREPFKKRNAVSKTHKDFHLRKVA